MRRPIASRYAALPVAFLFSTVAASYDVTDKLSLGGVLAGAYQYQLLDRTNGSAEEGGGALVLQPEISFRPTNRNEVFAKLGFAAGNGLNFKTPFTLVPWGADLELDVKGINGRDRDYLLTAWYQHTFEIGETNHLAVTGGLIDATDYLDENLYANDEYTQFLNPALVNSPNFFAPSYDLGAALQWQLGRISLRGVFMDVGANDDGRSFNYFGGEVGYQANSMLGEGNYRLVLFGTSADFLDPQGEREQERRGALVSVDQQLGKVLGLFVRLGWQDDGAAVNFRAIYSGGLDVSGRLWGRAQHNIGLGYAHLDGGSVNIDHTHIAEAYVRFALNAYLAFTVDLQYMRDDFRDGGFVQGFIPGVRLVGAF